MEFNLTKTRKTLPGLCTIQVWGDTPTETWVQSATRSFRTTASSTLMKMNRVAFTWRTISVLADRTSKLRSLQPWLQLPCVRQQLVTEAHDDLHGDCPITITQILLSKTMATTTRMSITLDIPSTRTSKPSSPESKSLLKTTFSRSSKQRSAVAGKFQNANLAPNALLPTVNTSCWPNNTFIKITEQSNAKTSTRTCIARTETGANSTTTWTRSMRRAKQGRAIAKVWIKFRT